VTADLDTLLIALYVELTDGTGAASSCSSAPARGRRPGSAWHNWQIGAPVKRSHIAYDH
jgi:hypothetical protein